MSKRLVLSALAQFAAKAAGRNMTKAAYAAVAAGVAAMVVLTTAPTYEARHPDLAETIDAEAQRRAQENK